MNLENILNQLNSSSPILVFITSILSILVIWITDRRQAKLSKKLQDERNSFEAAIRNQNEEAQKELEAYKAALNQRKIEFESELRKKEELLSIQTQHLFQTVQQSQDATRMTISSFQAMLKHARKMDAKLFLPEFGKSIAAFNAFCSTVERLENVVRRKDKQFLNRVKDRLLEILLAMRLEETKRCDDPSFLNRLENYEDDLKTYSSIFIAKYKLMLQPKGRNNVGS